MGREPSARGTEQGTRTPGLLPAGSAGARRCTSHCVRANGELDPSRGHRHRPCWAGRAGGSSGPEQVCSRRASSTQPGALRKGSLIRLPSGLVLAPGCKQKLPFPSVWVSLLAPGWALHSSSTPAWPCLQVVCTMRATGCDCLPCNTRSAADSGPACSRRNPGFAGCLGHISPAPCRAFTLESSREGAAGCAGLAAFTGPQPPRGLTSITGFKDREQHPSTHRWWRCWRKGCSGSQKPSWVPLCFLGSKKRL